MRYTFNEGDMVLAPYLFRTLPCKLTKLTSTTIFFNLDNDITGITLYFNGKAKSHHVLPFIVPATDKNIELVSQLFSIQYEKFREKDRVLIPLYYGISRVILPESSQGRFNLPECSMTIYGKQGEHSLQRMFHYTHQTLNIIKELYEI